MKGSGLAALATATLALGGCGGSAPSPHRAPTGPGREGSAAAPRLTRPPPAARGLRLDPATLRIPYIFLGVACPVGNSVACDRVGIFVSTGDVPEQVIATIGGRSVRLKNAGWKRGPGSEAGFQGFLQPAGLLGHGPLGVEPGQPTKGDRWYGTPTVTASVRLLAIYRKQGTYKERTIRDVRLNAGYG